MQRPIPRYEDEYTPSPRPAVRSVPMRTAGPRRPIVIPLGAVLIGAVLWPMGARFTIDGVLWGLNWVLTFLHMPVSIPQPSYLVYLALSPLPLLCSAVEWKPLAWDWQREARNPHGIVVWLFIVGVDVLTTYAGIHNPGPEAAPAFQEIARSLALSGILTLILTFGPEWLLREGWRKLWR